ncbi:MAG: GIY-YIG nuclease family protein [Nitrospirae bacterium]|nr:GIY-YIG nuclease family protein [Nitrospirota bacterium]
MEAKPHTFYYVYVLKNNDSNKLYIGSTNNLERRLEEHRKRAAFTLLYYEAYISEKDARIRESRLKKFGKAYQELKKRIGESLKGVGVNPTPFTENSNE